MKKLTSLLLVFALVFAFGGCGRDKNFSAQTDCKQILDAAIGATNYPDCEKLYLKQDANLSATDLSLWYSGLYSESDKLDLLDDYAIFLSSGVTTYEVAVLKPKKKSDLKELKALLEERRVTLSLGDKGMYDPDFTVRMENSLLYTDGDFLIFLLTENNSAAKKAINALK